jgi:hypothetical protein
MAGCHSGSANLACDQIGAEEFSRTWISLDFIRPSGLPLNAYPERFPCSAGRIIISALKDSGENEIRCRKARLENIGNARVQGEKLYARVYAYTRLLVCGFDLDACYSLPSFSMLIESPHRIFPSSSTRAKTPSRGIMQSPAL